LAVGLSRRKGHQEGFVLEDRREAGHLTVAVGGAVYNVMFKYVYASREAGAGG